ncbi:hypothetical protein [Microbulbifer variabilis]|uniref:hypothetical protein n=1 Tax=Microbulbifer variabilis TaxID=266805 RepID=UPI0003673B4A|nr:hypothetical protein [Microbulbifer variabilis]
MIRGNFHAAQKEKSTFQNMREGAEGLFEDLFRVRWHYRALNGDFGPEEQAHTLLADKTLTAAGALYYSDAQIDVNGEMVSFRSEVNSAVYEAISNNRAYFAGRQMAQGSMVGLMSRYSGTGLAGGAVFTTGFTTTAGFGRGLNFFDQGIRDPVSLISGSVVGK